MDIKSSAGSSRNNAVAVNNMLFTGLQGRTEADNRFVRNCIYLAQIAADSRCDSSLQPAEWFDYFAGGLWSCGWNPEEKPVVLVQKEFSGSVREAWRRLTAPLLARVQLEQVEAGLAALEKDVALLQRFTALSGKTFTSHIVPVSQNASGELVVVISHIRFFKLVLSTNYLFWQVHQPMSQLDIRARRLVIKRSAIDENREVVDQAIRESVVDLEEVEL
ncbi:hypothetical protein [Pseudomonas sp. RIT288]|jgi:hypothetical protein|uniref:hypothetical protein n=1 Tax=Pseudomonas sp. RIT288 TaxID=1470589 RepID=UPI000452DE86|nr:hypothetical protein [Pseudomonas sp. RIT288]EZP28514.1 hypothetical protein BW33_03869 [Pseudomonas sp. RIT288]